MSIVKKLWNYDEGDTFLSTDGALKWRMVHKRAPKYEFGKLGSIYFGHVGSMLDEEDSADIIRYHDQLDLGLTWYVTCLFFLCIADHKFVGIPIKFVSNSVWFLLLGQVSKRDQTKDINQVVYLTS